MKRDIPKVIESVRAEPVDYKFKTYNGAQYTKPGISTQAKAPPQATQNASASNDMS